MERLLKFYNQNRRIIWLIIFGIILFIAILNVLNNISKQNNQTKLEQSKESSNVRKESDYKENPNINVMISDEKVSEETKLVIDQFIRYCNAGQIENAYALLSNSCKEYLYPSIDTFKNNYINKNFSSTKLYSKESYLNRTYKVKLFEDVTATGKIITDAIEDYYTIVKQDDGSTKLNIGGYINEKELDGRANNSKIQVNILNKKVFVDYEEYIIEVKNLTDKEIKLDSLESTKNIYLSGDNNFKYYCLIHEKTDSELEIMPKSTKKVKLKFNVAYSSNSRKTNMNIDDIVLDNKEYNKAINKANYKERTTISIEI